MMFDDIRDFSEQLRYKPEIINGGNLLPKDNFIVVGMGGSHLAADLLKISHPKLNLTVHSDYGLPDIAEEELKKNLIILISYSGNTEEAIDAFLKTKEKDLSSAAVSVGGKLLELVKANQTPYIQLPQVVLEPRLASGFIFRAILKIIGDEKSLEKTNQLADILKPADFEDRSKNLAQKLKNFVPVIYSSMVNFPLSYNLKIKFNETTKIPAFANYFPELNHNEMAGFSTPETLSQKFYFLFLKDKSDDLRIQKRMEITEGIYRQKGFNVETIEISNENIFYKIFGAVILGDWTAYYLALEYGVDPEKVPIVEEFKNLMRSA